MSESVEPGATGQSSDPDALRSEIENTRQDLGETIDAIKHKTDPREQAKAAAHSAADNARQLGQKVYDKAPKPVADAYDKTREAVGPKATEAREKVRGHEGQVAAAAAGVVALLLVVRKVGRRRANRTENESTE